jgi:hypothetical protein
MQSVGAARLLLEKETREFEQQVAKEAKFWVRIWVSRSPVPESSFSGRRAGGLKEGRSRSVTLEEGSAE